MVQRGGVKYPILALIACLLLALSPTALAARPVGYRTASAGQALATTAETTITELDGMQAPQRATRLTCFFLSTAVGGTVRIYYLDPYGVARQWTSDTATSNTLLVVIVDALVPSARLTFAPSAATATLVHGECIHN